MLLKGVGAQMPIPSLSNYILPIFSICRTSNIGGKVGVGEGNRIPV